VTARTRTVDDGGERGERRADRGAAGYKPPRLELLGTIEPALLGSLPPPPPGYPYPDGYPRRR